HHRHRYPIPMTQSFQERPLVFRSLQKRENVNPCVNRAERFEALADDGHVQRAALLHNKPHIMQQAPGGSRRRPRRNRMKEKAGVWIDHRKAVIVKVTPTGEQTALIVSKVEQHLGRSGDSPLKGRYNHCRYRRTIAGRRRSLESSTSTTMPSSRLFVAPGPSSFLARARPRAS